MSKTRTFVILALLSVWLSIPSLAATKVLPSEADPNQFWRDVSQSDIATRGERWIQPQKARTVGLDFAALEARLKLAPMERTVLTNSSTLTIALPLPDGGYADFAMVESPVMEAALGKKYPGIRTYAGKGIHDPSASVRLDVTPIGFHAQVLSPKGDYYIDPYQISDNEHYVSYFRKDHTNDQKKYRCDTHGDDLSDQMRSALGTPLRNPSGATLRTYKIAIAATPTFTNSFGGTVANGLSGLVTLVNRVSGVYEREIAVRLVLVANNDLIVYTTANPGPLPDPPNAPSPQIQTTINNAIGFANYDIGHAVGGGGGGGAITPLGNVCGTQKAQGFTALNPPRGDIFDIDFVAHELGHQLGGSHTWFGCGGGGQWTQSSAMEPGSGTTIMAYAGICADNVLPNSDAYFHARSFTQIFQITENGGPGNANTVCGTVAPTGNTPPNITAPANFTIPKQTPFQLTATGSDSNAGDVISYNWEQVDTGAASAPPSTTGDNGTAPLFRSFNASTSPTRIFPSLKYILDNANVAPVNVSYPPAAGSYFSAEILPNPATGTRVMKFRVTARDNAIGGGGLRHAEMQVTAAAASGPFSVNNPRGLASGGSTLALTWNVAGSDQAPVGTSLVNILISLDGGYTFTQLLANTANDGLESITLPNVATNSARFRVEAANGNGIAAGSTWFDVTDTNFEITTGGTAVTATAGAPILTSQGAPLPANVNVATIAGGTAPYSAVAAIYPPIPEISIENLTVSGGNVSATARAACQIAAPNAPTFRTYPAVLRVTDSAGSAASTVFSVNVSNNIIPSIGTFANQSIARGNSVNASPSAAPADANGNFVEVRVSPTTLPGGGTVTVNPSTGAVTINTTSATTLGSYLIKVTAFDSCGAGGVGTLLATVTSVDPVLQLNSNTVTSGNAIIEPNECNTLSVVLGNIGGGPATGITSVLSTSTPGVSIATANSNYPNIAGSGGSGINSTAYQISSASSLACGSTVNLTQTVSYAGAGSPSIFNFALPVGQPAAANYAIAVSESAPAAPGSVLVAGTQDDDITAPVALPSGFAFSIYGTPVTQLSADTNGILGFNTAAGASSAGNGPLPAGIFATPSVVAHWDDLDGSVGATIGGGVYTAVSGSAPNRIFDIEWRMTRFVPDAVLGPPTIIFTIRLHETSNLIEIVYTNVIGNLGQNGPGTNGNSATVGIQAASTGTQFTQFSVDTASLAANRKLSFTRAAGSCQQGASVCIDPSVLFKNGFED
jgi:hypothetical protein